MGMKEVLKSLINHYVIIDYVTADSFYRVVDMGEVRE